MVSIKPLWTRLRELPTNGKSRVTYLRGCLECNLFSSSFSTALEAFYSISFMYYSLIGTALTVLIGTLISCLTQHSDDEYDAKLLHPIIFRCYERLNVPKPYYIKHEEESGLNRRSSSNSSATTTCNKDEKINHAFDPTPNEAKTNPIATVFTNSSASAGDVERRGSICNTSRIQLDAVPAGETGVYRHLGSKTTL